ncbi:hypothetical protein OS493_010612 [Desmophyllum pertusum]|uniref:THAP-type domain-containing protein n=1 Tax=Desmophyllum pertusum TaxID=174260 RepID=A0A9X0D3R6_9CNID|nr:hypothetical protein OS493_010612 [Desmophyllum pertusum]
MTESPKEPKNEGRCRSSMILELTALSMGLPHQPNALDNRFVGIVHFSESCGKPMWQRANFSPTGRFVVCSDHFTEDCFARSLHVEGSMKCLESGSVSDNMEKNERPNTSTSSRDRRTMLRTINELPSPDDNAQSMEIDESSSSQPGPSSSDQNQLTLAEANQVLVEDSVSEVSDDLAFSIKIVFVFHTHKTPKTLISDRLLARLYHKRVFEETQESGEETQDETTPQSLHMDVNESELDSTSPPLHQTTPAVPDVRNVECQSLCEDDITSESIAEEQHAEKCQSCKLLRNEVTLLKGKVTRLQRKMSNNQEQWVDTFKEIQQQKQLLMVNAVTQTPDEIPTALKSGKDSQGVESDEKDSSQELPEEFMFSDPQEDQFSDPREDQEDCFDEDPTWTPEDIDRAYENMKEDDESPMNENPRYDMHLTFYYMCKQGLTYKNIGGLFIV